jgi:uncharacterized protein YqjF (DUF2071 family)
MGAVFLTAHWRDIAMLNYEVPPELLHAHVPRGTELDTFEGKALVSVVGFRFMQTRVRGVPIPGHQDFEEINLRFYVRSQAQPERRGVVFIKEIVPRRAVTWVARALYHENYHTHAMRHAVRALGAATMYSYELDAGGRSHRLLASVTAPAQPLVPGSETEFIAEHYYGYTRQPDGGTVEYRVDHPPWLAHPVYKAELDFDVSALYGEAFAAFVGVQPRSALVAIGSEVSVGAPVRIA